MSLRYEKDILREARIELHRLKVTINQLAGLEDEIVRFMPMLKYTAISLSEPAANQNMNMPVDITVRSLLELLSIKLDN